MTPDLIIARARRLCLLNDLMRAKRNHRPTRRLRRALRDASNEVLRLEVGKNG